MRMVKVLMGPDLLDDVRRSLAKVKIETLVLSEALNAEPRAGQTRWYRGRSYLADAPSLKLELVVSESELDDVLQALADAVQPTVGAELQVVVTAIEDLMRIRSGPCGVHTY